MSRLLPFLKNGRDDRIRTCDLIVPNDALYQAEPHPDIESIVMVFGHFVKHCARAGYILRIVPLLLPLCVQLLCAVL